MELLSESLGFQINIVARTLRMALEKRLSKVGVTPSQWMLLMALGEKDFQNQTDLSRKLSLDPTTITHIVDKLEKMKLLQRNPKKDDRRTQIVSLTRKGRKAYLDWMRLGEEVNRHATDGMTPEDNNRLLDWLALIHNNLVTLNGRWK